MSKNGFSLQDLLPVTLVTLLFISQIIVGLELLSDVTQIELVAYVGVALYVVSGIIFGMFPVIEFRRKGRVRPGASYIHTTQLVDTGIYSVVRHPQYVTFILWAIAGMLLFQHWIVVVVGIPIVPLTYIDLIRADRNAVAKFGDDYKRYMQKVPRMNFMVGILRLLKRRKRAP